jgi:hypothetical protein
MLKVLRPTIGPQWRMNSGGQMGWMQWSGARV